jgi:hypothetical protein
VMELIFSDSCCLCRAATAASEVSSSIQRGLHDKTRRQQSTDKDGRKTYREPERIVIPRSFLAPFLGCGVHMQGLLRSVCWTDPLIRSLNVLGPLLLGHVTKARRTNRQQLTAPISQEYLVWNFYQVLFFLYFFSHLSQLIWCLKH